jgi:hypothetical protein
VIHTRDAVRTLSIGVYVFDPAELTNNSIVCSIDDDAAGCNLLILKESSPKKYTVFMEGHSYRQVIKYRLLQGGNTAKENAPTEWAR